ncbi:MAG TPA: monovalent cation:proton antiporter-2 (CPA2) family protein [Steroidobacteraceae bacterium]|nr:monovalent cation:proton antiporter-2 (CPA2) family protein [Steroidobacteraceae bacterium]
MSLTAQVALLLAAAVVAVPLFRKLRLGAVLGYLAAGMLVGPSGLGLISNVDAILRLAEFGVVLLLFVIGLELQPSRLIAMRRTVFGVGALQVALTTLVLAVVAWAFGASQGNAVLLGFALSLSSTALVLQVLAERAELKANHARAAFGTLLFQDIAAMAVLTVLPLVGASAAHPGGGARGWVTGLAALIVVIAGGRYALRPLLRVVADSRMRETFTATALLVVVGTALLFSATGLSMALGAFIAGVLLADSEYRHELEADIEPFKGLLLGLFFIATGMSASIATLLERPSAVLGLLALLLALKAVTGWVVARLTGYAGAGARRFATELCGGGEFAFVLLALAARSRLLDPQTGDLIVIVVALSMIATPLLINAHAFLESWLAPAAVPAPFDTPEPTEPRVLIAGFGRFGQIVGRVLRARGIRFTALEVSQAQVDFVRRFGNKLYYGDASRLELLHAAGAGQAEVLVIAIDDVEASVRTAAMVRRHFPALKVLARARNRQHAFRLMDLGVASVIRETYASSLEVAHETLVALGVPPAEARRSVKLFREHDEHTLAAQQAIEEDQEKLIAAAKESAAQLERLFQSDLNRD